MNWDLIIIGGGVAAKTLAHLYLEQKKGQSKRVLQIDAGDLLPSASLVPTILLSLAGTQEGISPLGDTLVSSWKLALKYFAKYQPHGVEKVEHWDLADPAQKEAWPLFLSRYQTRSQELITMEQFFSSPLTCFKQPAWLIESGRYLQWLQEKAEDLGLTLKKDVLLGFEQQAGSTFLRLKSGEKHHSPQVVLALGAWIDQLGDFLQIPKTEALSSYKLQTVAGAQWQASVRGWGEKSFALSLARSNFFYQAQTQKIAIGNTSQMGTSFAPDLKHLEEQYQLFQKYWQGPAMPPFAQGKIYSGLRAKGSKRRPWWGEIATRGDTRLWAILGLYKNGYNFAHEASDSIVSSLL